ncbi:MAG: nuclear transport factor 2 family protein [Candidatus Binataceae bacterium]
MANEELARRIAMLEDIEAIKKLKARYCLVCDDNHNPAEITKLFAEDGIWEGDGIGAQQGHAAIRALFQKFQERIAFSQHNVFNPIINVDGDHAKGSWYFLGPFTFRKGNRQMWLAARYEEDYVKVNGDWKFQHLRAIGRMAAPYETGWAKKDVP